MNQSEILKNLPDNFKRSFGEEYAGATNIEEVLDLTDYMDDPDGLMKVMASQASVYAFWSNLKRLADEQYDKALEDFEVWKSKQIRRVIEHITSEGVKTPTGKLIETKFIALYNKNDMYKAFMGKVKFWKKRKEILSIAEKAVESREKNFRSLSYLLGKMMDNGFLTVTKTNKSKRME